MLHFKNLHAYQLHCVTHLIENESAGLLLEMGLGKTISALTAFKQLQDELSVDTALVVAPKKVAENVWHREVEKWSHLAGLKVCRIMGNEKKRLHAIKEPADVYTISTNLFGWLCDQFGGLMLPYDVLILDELSKFKNDGSELHKAAKIVRPSFARVWGLTGTPIPNGLLDIWPQIYLLDGGKRLGESKTFFKQKYFDHSAHSGYSKYVLRDGAEKIIYQKIGDICISMKTADYLDLPGRINNYVDIEFSAKLMARYKEFEREQIMAFLQEDEHGEKEVVADTAAALSNKLLQFANGTVYSNPEIVYDEDYDWEGDEEPKTTRESLPVHALKLDAVEQIVEAANGKPVLIFWTFRHDRDRLVKRLKKYHPATTIDGEDIDAWNAGETQIQLMHPASGGHGLNLQDGGNIIIWFGQTWNLEWKQQADARLHRQGQKNQVVIHHLVSKGTIDERVVKRGDEKSADQNDFMAAVKAMVKEYKNGK
jgi:SNF2 family DNA or RNA helicase